jgi:hypothetical protein
MYGELPGEITPQPDQRLIEIARVGWITQQRAHRSQIMDEALLELARAKELSGERVSQLLGRVRAVYYLAENALPWHAV